MSKRRIDNAIFRDHAKHDLTAPRRSLQEDQAAEPTPRGLQPMTLDEVNIVAGMLELGPNPSETCQDFNARMHLTLKKFREATVK